MILLLGATTYVGQAFARALRSRKDSFIPLSRNAFDYTRFEFLFDYVRKIKPDLVINSAGTTDTLTEEATESDRMQMLQDNTLLPQTISRVCSMTNTPWGHISSGSIYLGAKVAENGGFRVEEDLSLPSAQHLFVAHPEILRGFTETDAPNFSFKSTPCTFYSGTKALAEESLRNSRNYIWRLRLPFNDQDDPFNYLSQIQDANKVHDGINSLSHLDDCVGACLELWERQAPFGIYNVVNPGAVRTFEVLRTVQRMRKTSRPFQLLDYDRIAQPNGARTLRSDCILDGSKLLKAGVKLRPVQQAIESSIQKWQPSTARAIKTLKA